MTTPNIYDAATAWLRQSHAVNVPADYPSYWTCSCGKRGNPDTIPTPGRSRAASERHLRAERNKWLRDEENYLAHLRLSGLVQDARETML